MTHESVMIPKRPDTAAVQDAQQLPPRRMRNVAALALAAIVALLGVLARPAHPHARRW